MRDYEIVYIFDSMLDEEKIDAKLERYHGIVAANDGAEVKAVDHWGKRQLAYPIQKKTSGYYVVAQLSAEAEALPELERNLKLDEELLRHLIVIDVGLPTAPMSEATPADRRSDDDRDDDDDED